MKKIKGLFYLKRYLISEWDLIEVVKCHFVLVLHPLLHISRRVIFQPAVRVRNLCSEVIIGLISFFYDGVLDALCLNRQSLLG